MQGKGVLRPPLIHRFSPVHSLLLAEIKRTCSLSLQLAKHLSMKRLLMILVLVLAALPAIADEGMWMPQQIPALADRLKSARVHR